MAHDPDFFKGWGNLTPAQCETLIEVSERVLGRGMTVEEITSALDEASAALYKAHLVTLAFKGKAVLVHWAFRHSDGRIEFGVDLFRTDSRVLRDAAVRTSGGYRVLSLMAD